MESNVRRQLESQGVFCAWCNDRSRNAGSCTATKPHGGKTDATLSDE
jgi:hypothetical protein